MNPTNSNPPNSLGLPTVSSASQGNTQQDTVEAVVDILFRDLGCLAVVVRSSLETNGVPVSAVPHPSVMPNPNVRERELFSALLRSARSPQSPLIQTLLAVLPRPDTGYSSGRPPMPDPSMQTPGTLARSMPPSDSTSRSPFSTMRASEPFHPLVTRTDPMAKRDGSPKTFHPNLSITHAQPRESAQAASAATPQDPPRSFWLAKEFGWDFPPQANGGSQPYVTNSRVLARCLTCSDWVLPTPLVTYEHETLQDEKEQVPCHHHKNGRVSCGNSGCTSTFQSLRFRTLHMNTAHGRENCCGSCGKFLSADKSDGTIQNFSLSLEVHLLREHLGIGGWECRFCSQRCPTLPQLSKHLSQASKVPHDPMGVVDLRAQYMVQGTGLPSNAHYIDGPNGTTIVAYAVGTQPRVSRPVNWLALCSTSS